MEKRRTIGDFLCEHPFSAVLIADIICSAVVKVAKILKEKGED